VRQVLEELSRVRGVEAEELERITDANAERFFHS
jgi:Tat protein secretion system quality control protein TatD with DNase activity